MEEWKEYKLGDIAQVKGGKRLPKGVNLVKAKNSHPYIRVRDLGKKKVLELDSSFEYVDNETQKSISRYIVNSGDIIVSIVGTIGLIAIIGNSLDKANLTENCVKLIDITAIDKEYLYYYLVSELGKNEIEKGIVGAVQAKLPIKNIQAINIKAPNLESQRRIASILKSLDDKIEVNRRINENLEQQAQALFKSWFVDFEPFLDKPSGKAERKNGEFVESELGIIPKGWRVGTLDEIGDVVGGSTPSKSKPEFYTDKGIAWLTPKDLSISNNKFTAKGEIDITEEGYKSCSTKLMPKGSVLFSSRAPIGYITIAKNDICTNQGFKSVVPKLAGTAFIYYFLKISTKDIENKATGSTFKEASGALMKSLQLIIAPERILHDFENIMKPLFTQQEVLEDESRRLAELRDTLLPKLMSGEFFASKASQAPSESK